jgi:hypothetical protein
VRALGARSLGGGVTVRWGLDLFTGGPEGEIQGEKIGSWF